MVVRSDEDQLGKILGDPLSAIIRRKAFFPVWWIRMYHLDTDPDPGSEKIHSVPDPEQTLIRIRIQAKKDSVPYQERSYLMFCVFILLDYYFSINNHLN